MEHLFVHLFVHFMQLALSLCCMARLLRVLHLRSLNTPFSRKLPSIYLSTTITRTDIRRSITTMSTNSNQQSSKTIQTDVAEVFRSIEAKFTNTKLGDRWYLLTLAALVGGTEPELADQLYLYIINKPDYQSSTSRQALVRRLREGLMKLISIIGVCKPIEAILAISKVERPEDRDFSFSRENWKNDSENHEKAMEWMRKIYTTNLDTTLDLFNAHRDFRWLSTEITYGLYLSDRQNLDDWDTELLVLVGIMIQNLRLETHWHIRGTRRIGVEKKDVEVIVGCVRELAKFMGVKLDRVPTVEEVEDDV